MRSPQPLRFKYNTLATTVSQNADDFEAIKIEQDQGPNRWQAIELMPEEVDQIMEQIAAGKKEGVVTHVGDITNKTKYSVTDKGITLIGWATDNKGANPVGESMAVVLKLKHFEQIEGWMVRYEEDFVESVQVKDHIQAAFEADVLSILGYNK
jgi:hypothetical protein